MKHSPHVLLPYSIEAFLTNDEVEQITGSIERYKAANPRRLKAGATGISIHKNADLTLSEIIAVYEPAGRLDVNTQHLPRDIIEIAERAFFRHIENIRRAYPTSHKPYGFTYVEYDVGQYFTPHVDGVQKGTGQIAGFGITLTDDFDGGEFIVETCGSNRLWVQDSDGTLMIGPGHDSSTQWFRSLPRTTWLTRPKRGNAIFYGGALTHASKPVTRGQLKKLLAFIR
jgi:predicted 2-oxoglutarate/Fe(II)-dependent dioxygenase YbiX